MIALVLRRQLPDELAAERAEGDGAVEQLEHQLHAGGLAQRAGLDEDPVALLHERLDGRGRQADAVLAALAAHLSAQCGLQCEFVDVDNPV